METHLTPTVWESFRYRARSFPQRPAVVDETSFLTFAEAFDQAGRLAGTLMKEGIVPGTPVALGLQNSPVFIPAFLALARIPVTVILLSPRYGSSELRTLADRLRIRAVLAMPVRATEIQEALGDCDLPRPLALDRSMHGLTLLMRTPGLNGRISISPEQEALLSKSALIKTTSGSTGEPKSVAIEAEAVLTEAENVARSLSLGPGHKVLAPVPLTHSYGFDLGVLATLFSGATLEVVETFVPRGTLRKLAGRGTTVFLGVPSMYQLLLDGQKGNATSLAHIPYLLSCTAPLPVRTIHAFHDAFGASICQHYGSSETGAIATHVPSSVMAKPESAGRPIDNVTVSIADESGNGLPCGNEGELIVRSGATASGYVTGAPARNPFDGEWYRTGDRGTMDEEGFLFLTGRLDDMINVGGLKVSPQEVVRVLESLPQVREAAVIGRADPSAGQVVYAAVTLNNPATEEDLIRACTERLADYKVPRRIEIRTELPRGPSGKIRFRQEDIRLA
ncbi:MAG: class I adenylate-forming enzyme family protein [Bacteroidota bacterium]